MKRSLRSWLWRVPLDQEVDEELSLHLELHTRDLVKRGMDRARANWPSAGWAMSHASGARAWTWAESETEKCASQPLDLATFAAVAVTLAFTAAVAIAAPAWRATQIDPAAALRSE